MKTSSKKFVLQREHAKINLLYLKETMYLKILNQIVKLLLPFIIAVIFGQKVLYILALIDFLYTSYKIYSIYNNYTYLIKDIEEVFNINEYLEVEISFKSILKFFKYIRKVENYGK